MQIREILNQENENTGKIILRKEGIFWRAYEHSAYFFVKHIKSYNLTKSFFKNINANMVYLGFPDSLLLSVLEQVEQKINMENETKFIEFGNYSFLENEYETWKNSIQLKEREVTKKTKCENSEIETILRIKIKNFNVTAKTPMECQQFVIELQNLIYGLI